MKNLLNSVLFASALGLIGCGGGGSSSNSTASTTNTGPILTASPISLTFNGKQFAEPLAAQRINLTFDRDVVSIVSVTLTGDAEFEGRDVFSFSSDSSNTFADVRINNSDIEGGTYMDTLVLEPNLRAGGFGNTVTVDLTLIQEATTPITATINDPAAEPVQVVEDGPPVRLAASVNTGNTIRWAVVPTRFDADDVDVVTTDPAEGIGSEQVDVVIVPTPALVESIRTNGSEFIDVNFQDLDNPGNFTQLILEVTLTE